MRPFEHAGPAMKCARRSDRPCVLLALGPRRPGTGQQEPECRSRHKAIIARGGRRFLGFSWKGLLNSAAKPPDAFLLDLF